MTAPPELAQLEDAYRSVTSEVCRADLSLAEGRDLKFRAGDLVRQMKAIRRRHHMAVSGEQWLREIVRGRGP